MDREYVLGEVPSDFAELVRRKPKSLISKRIRVPEFCLEKKKPSGASHSRETAERQAEMIRLAWRRVGYEVNPVIGSRLEEGRTCYFVMTPDLINGLPLSAYYGRNKS